MSTAGISSFSGDTANLQSLKKGKEPPPKESNYTNNLSVSIFNRDNHGSNAGSSDIGNTNSISLSA